MFLGNVDYCIYGCHKGITLYAKYELWIESLKLTSLLLMKVLILTCCKGPEQFSIDLFS